MQKFDVSLNPMKRKILAVFSPLFLLFGSDCHNDLKLNAPYKEMPSIYAVINPQEYAHIIRVNKIFLGEGDANVMAKAADSVNYQPGDLTITLERFESGSDYTKQIDAAPLASNPNLLNSPERRRTILFHDTLIQTDPGAFSTTQRAYVCYDNLHDGLPLISSTTSVNINPNWKVSGDYLLTVKNNKTGNVFRAKSTIVDSVRTGVKPFSIPYYPYPPAYTADPYNTDYYMDYSSLAKLYDVRFPPNEAQVYQLTIRIHFWDDVGYKIYRHVDYQGNDMYPINARKIGGGTYLVSEFKGTDIYNAVGVGLKQQGLNDNVAGRKIYMMEYLVYNSTQDYVDYMEFVKPSFNISQTKPLYSNFENRAALGIFTFRSRCSVKKEPAASYVNSFSENPQTCYYKFLAYDNTYWGCK